MAQLHIFKTLPFIFLQIIAFKFVGTEALLPRYVYHGCDNTTANYSQNVEYQSNFFTLLTDLTVNAATNKFYTTTSGTTPNEIFGLFYCRGDVDSQLCYDCVKTAARNTIVYCPFLKEAVIYYQECTLRYANRDIFSQDDNFNWVFHYIKANVSDPIELHQQLSKTMPRLINIAAYNSSSVGYATGEANLSQAGTLALYCLVQCTLDILGLPCDRCLNEALSETQGYSYKMLYIFKPSCQLMYDTKPFYPISYSPNSAPPPQPPSFLPSPGNSRSRASLIAGSSAAAVVLVLILLGTLIYKRKRTVLRKRNDDSKRFVDSLQYDLSTLRSATRNFSAESKLGEGGFGEVYRGKLDNGQEIAVKRLSKNSGQGITEFETEIILVARLQHKNLVKLLGYCAAPKHSLLVYEFLPNLSLDKLLFDPMKKGSLGWETRFRIIIGVARGLLYLHEDSRIKVVHRDLKSSNILLDEAMNPKIADFGLARLFGVDQTQGDTKRIVGTYGYMAPEYAITGHYSMKSDVYSFGVIVLEIISGKRSTYFGGLQPQEALLHQAWRLWNDEEALDMVDTELRGTFVKEEVLQCIQIGLLCIQEDAVDRPRMTSIVAALSGQSISLPAPKQPHFFGRNSDTDAQQTVYTGTETISDLHSRD